MKEAERGIVKVGREREKKKKTRINLFIRHILLPPFEDPACFLSRDFIPSTARFPPSLSDMRFQFSPQLESFTLLFPSIFCFAEEFLRKKTRMRKRKKRIKNSFPSNPSDDNRRA